MTATPDDIELQQTCGACPEQYDAIWKGVGVGYLRLRHGIFRVDCPDCGDETVLMEMVKGDGKFEPEERDRYLHKAKVAIAKWLESNPDHSEESPW